MNYCLSQTVSSIFSVYLLGNTKKTNIGWLHRLYLIGTSLGGLWVIVVLVHGRRRAGHFSPHGGLWVIVIIVNGRRCSGHFSPRGELSVIVILINAEPYGANHLAMMFQNSNQMPTPLLGCLIAVRLRLVTCGPLPLAHSHECNSHRVQANGQQRNGAVGWLWQHDGEVGWLWLSDGRCNRLFDGRRDGRRDRQMGSGGMEWWDGMRGGVRGE